MNYYKVTCVAGHQGVGNHNETITFYYKEKDALSAIYRAKRQPGVKHTRLPLSCISVPEAEYQAGIKVSAYVRAGM